MKTPWEIWVMRAIGVVLVILGVAWIALVLTIFPSWEGGAR